MKKFGQLGDAKVGEVMTQQVVTLSANDSIQDAAQIMLENKLSTVPVVNTANKCIGILSRADLTELFLEQDDGLSRLLDTDRLSLEWFYRSMETSESRQVHELMTENVSTINANKKLPDACREMVRNRIHHLPVVDDSDKILGILSTFDIVNAIANTPAE